jgi:hypothetical protein
VWLTSSDLRNDEHGPYGIPWHDDLSDQKRRNDIIQMYKLDEGLVEGTSIETWYHGTDYLIAEHVVARDRLRASKEPAMLGVGVYFGSFWKACRYAMFANTRDWSERRERLRGSIIRCIVLFHEPKYKNLPDSKYTCLCDKCSKRIESAWTTEQKLLRHNQSKISDHDSTWIRDGHYCIVIRDTLGTMSHNELCVRDDRIRSDVVAFDHAELNMRTRTEPYDAASRHHRCELVESDDT